MRILEIDYPLLRIILKAYFDRGGSLEALRVIASLDRLQDDSSICAVLYQLYREGRLVSYEIFYSELQLYLKKNRKRLTPSEEALLEEVVKVGGVQYLDVRLSDYSYALERVEQHLKLKSFKNLMERVNSVLENPDISDNSILDYLSSEMKKSYEEMLSTDILLGKTRYISYKDVGPRPYYVLNEGESRNVKTGIPFIDNSITKGKGIEKGWFVVFAAGTGIGKTTLMTNIAAETFRMGEKVLYISLEMTEREIARRIDSILTGIPLSELMKLSSETEDPASSYMGETYSGFSRQDIHEKVISKLKEETKSLLDKNADLVIVYYPSMSIHASYVRNILAEFKLMGKVFDIVIIDFADYFKSGSGSDAPYWESVAEAFKYLPGIARENDVAIITATEINKRDAERGDISLASVYGSSSKSFGADLVLGIERRPDALSSTFGDTGARTIKVLKYRHGPAGGNWDITFDPETLKVISNG